MLFKIVADAEFEAMNIHDAFKYLSDHFRNLSTGNCSKLSKGIIEVYSIDRNTDG